MEILKKIGYGFLILMFFAVSAFIKDISKANSINYNQNEKTLEQIDIFPPKPVNKVYGMNPINADEHLYIEFDNYYDVQNHGKSVLCDWIDSSGENELRITVVHLTDKQVSKDETFANMTISQKNEWIRQMKIVNDNMAKSMNMKNQNIDDGYYKINGNAVLWISSIVQYEGTPKAQNAFYYYVLKDRKNYVISYFSNNCQYNQPNDVILSSLNTLQVK